MLKHNIRKIKDIFSLANIGTYACLFMALCYLASFVLTLFNSRMLNESLDQSSYIYNLFLILINVVFFVLTGLDFNKSRNDFSRAFQAMFYLSFSYYVLPLISGIVLSILLATSFSSFIMMLISTITSLVLGVIYFIFMILENKNREKKYQKILLVLGILISAFALFTFVLTLYSLFSSMVDSSNDSLYYNIIFKDIDISIEFIAALCTFLISFLYLKYALALKEERNY